MTTKTIPITKQQKLASLKQFINKNGKLITITNGKSLALDTTVDNEYYPNATINVVIVSTEGYGTAYYCDNGWFFSGLAPFDLGFKHIKDKLTSPKFITAEQFHKWRLI